MLAKRLCLQVAQNRYEQLSKMRALSFLFIFILPVGGINLAHT